MGRAQELCIGVSMSRASGTFMLQTSSWPDMTSEVASWRIAFQS